MCIYDFPRARISTTEFLFAEGLLLFHRGSARNKSFHAGLDDDGDNRLSDFQRERDTQGTPVANKQTTKKEVRTERREINQQQLLFSSTRTGSKRGTAVTRKHKKTIKGLRFMVVNKSSLMGELGGWCRKVLLECLLQDFPPTFLEHFCVLLPSLTGGTIGAKIVGLWFIC